MNKNANCELAQLRRAQTPRCEDARRGAGGHQANSITHMHIGNCISRRPPCLHSMLRLNALSFIDCTHVRQWSGPVRERPGRPQKSRPQMLTNTMATLYVQTTKKLKYVLEAQSSSRFEGPGTRRRSRFRVFVPRSRRMKTGRCIL
jgi:hypothetical protein